MQQTRREPLSRYSNAVKNVLFLSFCTSMNATQVWCNFRKVCMQRLRVACNFVHRALYQGLQIVGRDRHSNLCREIILIHFKFAILVWQNKCNHLLFYVLNFIQFCARKFLLSIVILKLIFNFEAFHTKWNTFEMFWPREFRTVFLG